MTCSLEYRPLSTSGLARLAARLGRAFVSPSTWCRIARAAGWRRPRQRVYPAKPKIGVRAGNPNQIWHLDTSVLRLLDGSRVYLHAIIDNFSRRILAWQVNSNFDTHVTSQLIQQAAKGIGTVPRVVMDSGIEIVNQTVDKLIDESIIRRVLAQVDVQYSNSMIEAFWRQLKNQWLYLNTLDNICTVRRLIQFYVQQHNSVIPHSAHRGQTPDEMYFGTGQAIPEQLAKQQLDARQQRLATNRATTCAQCQSEPTFVNIAETS
jgi:transposase InsO family protein